MKPNAILIAVLLACAAGVGAAAGQAPAARSNVADGSVAQCATPKNLAEPACERFRKLLQANFNQRELDVLFGHRPPPGGRPDGQLQQLQKRYSAVIQQYLAAIAADG